MKTMMACLLAHLVVLIRRLHGRLVHRCFLVFPAVRRCFYVFTLVRWCSDLATSLGIVRFVRF